MKVGTLLFVACTLIVSGPVFSQDSLRCRGKIIDRGMEMEEVQRHCDKPDFSSVDNQAIHSGNRISGTTPITTWHDNQPGGLLIAVLVFDQDKLRSIEYLDSMQEG
jgi:hypothetical protein